MTLRKLLLLLILLSSLIIPTNATAINSVCVEKCNFQGLFKNAQMQGAHKRATGADKAGKLRQVDEGKPPRQ